MAVLSVHHISMVVANTQQSVRFYQEILELELCPDRPDLDFPGAWLNIGEQQIHLLEVPNPDPVTDRPAHGGRDRHLALSVDNLAEIEQRLVDKGIEYTKSRSGRAALFFRDPDGNTLELIEKR